jgi:hypothetical protein
MMHKEMQGANWIPAAKKSKKERNFYGTLPKLTKL